MFPKICITSIILLLLLNLKFCTCKDAITVGTFFSEDTKQVNMPFKSLIYSNNLMNRKIFINSNITNILDRDAYDLQEMVLNLTNSPTPLLAIIGPSTAKETAIVESTAAALGVLHLQTTCHYRPVERHATLNFCPPAHLLGRAMAVVVRHLEWRNFVILYEDEEGLIRLQEVLKLQEYDPESNKNQVTVRRLGSGPDYRSLLKEINNITSITQYILDCRFEILLDVLDQAYEVNLMGPFKSFFLTSLDAHTLDFRKYGYETNITTIRMTNPDDRDFQTTVESWRFPEYQEEYSYPRVDDIMVNTALFYDALHYLLETVNSLKPASVKALKDPTQKEEVLSEILDTMKKRTEENALTGPIEFDDQGNRINFVFQVIDVNHSNKVIATWNGKTPDELYLNRSREEYMQTIEEDLKKTVVQVYSKLGEPYLRMVKPAEGEVLTGNARYEGFSIEFIQAIANFVGFQFEMKLVYDGYGKYNPDTKKWDGLISKVMEKKAHLAICDFTISRQRLSLIDFSTHFMTLGIAILLKKPELSQETQLFSFMNPFGIDVWIYTATLYLIITVSLYFIARMSNADWESPHPCDQELDEQETIWEMKNCLWVTGGSIMTQGCDILPKGISSRTAVCMWWFFCLIIPNTYTANLAAFMTHQGDDVTVDSVDELAEQTKVKYGTLYKGSTYYFFKESEYPIYQKMWVAMQQAKPSVFCNDNAEGVSMVENSKGGLYAFLMESTQIEYVTETKCNLKQVGQWLDTRRYGIGMPLNAPYRSIINNAILKLQENGTIEEIKKKWWKEKRNEPRCKQEEEAEEDTGSLGLGNVGGVFIVLFVGIVVCYIIGICEFLWSVKNIAKDQHISFWTAFVLEVKFAVNFKITKKLLELPPEALESSSSTSSEAAERDMKTIARAIMQSTESILAVDLD